MARKMKDWRKHAPDNFVNAIDSMSNEELKKVILESTQKISDTNKYREEDEQLQALKEKAKDLNDAYNDTIKGFKAKIMGALATLEERGIPLP